MTAKKLKPMTGRELRPLLKHDQHLIQGWLLRQRSDSSADDIKEHLDKAKAGGWDIPNWMYTIRHEDEE